MGEHYGKARNQSCPALFGFSGVLLEDSHMLNDSVTALWAMIGTGVTAIATVGLIVAAWLAWRTASETLAQMKTDSDAAVAPYVAAQIVPSLSGAGNWDLQVWNAGKTPAKGLLLKFGEFPEGVNDEFTRAIRDLEKQAIDLMPGQSFRVYWRLTLEEGHSWSTGGNAPAGMGESGTVTALYKDRSGKTYKEMIALGLRHLYMSPIPEDGPNLPKDPHKLSDDQKDTHKMLAVLARALGELRR